MNASAIELQNIKAWLCQGAITYDKAKEMAKPHIEALNGKAREIAKRRGVRPRRVTFAAFMR